MHVETYSEIFFYPREVLLAYMNAKYFKDLIDKS